MRQIIFSLVLFGLSVVPILNGADPQRPVLDVCTALAQLNKIDGQIVSIRGEAESALGGLFGEKCTGKLRLDDESWPWAVGLTFASDSSLPENGDRTSSVSQFRSLLKEKQPSEIRILVTLEGRLTSYQPKRPTTDKQASTVRMDGFPAVLEVKEARDIVFEVQRVTEKIN